MSKYNIGDKVRCLGKSEFTAQHFSSGWRKDLEFKVITITRTTAGDYIYWAGGDGAGVYEEHLELARRKNVWKGTRR